MSLELLHIDALNSEIVPFELIHKEDKVLKRSFVEYIDNVSTKYIAFTVNKFDSSTNLYDDYIYSINSSNNDISNIECKSYKKNDNKYYGESITCMGGINTLYYQVMNLNGENLENGEGKPMIYSNSLTEYPVTKFLEFDKPVLFISGREDIIFTSNYCFYKPEKNTGRCFSIFDNSYTNISKVNTGSDIIDVKKFKNSSEYVIFNGRDIILYDAEKKHIWRLIA